MLQLLAALPIGENCLCRNPLDKTPSQSIAWYCPSHVYCQLDPKESLYGCSHAL